MECLHVGACIYCLFVFIILAANRQMYFSRQNKDLVAQPCWCTFELFAEPTHKKVATLCSLHFCKPHRGCNLLCILA